MLSPARVPLTRRCAHVRCHSAHTAARCGVPTHPIPPVLLLQNKVAAGMLKMAQAHVRELPYTQAELAAFKGNKENAVEMFNRPYRARDKHGIDLEDPALQPRVMPYFRWMRETLGGSDIDDNNVVRARDNNGVGQAAGCGQARLDAVSALANVVRLGGCSL